MIRTLFLLLILFGFACSPQAQDLIYEEYNWEPTPVLHALDSMESAVAALYIKDLRAYEYTYEDDEDLVMYYTEHKVIRINDASAVEDYNKFFIPMYGTIDLIGMKARSVSPEGKVVEVEGDRIKELENLENAGAFRIFAVEGVQPGGEVEYWYTVKRQPRLFGREVYQTNLPVREAVFDMISPANLVFELKSYNGFPESVDSMYRFRRRLHVESRDLEAAYRERYAAYEPHLQRIEYKLNYNLFSGDDPLFTWEEAAQRYYSMVYEPDKLDRKAVVRMLKELDLKGDGVELKIEKIERFIKSNIALQDGTGDEFNKISEILENKYASDFGYLRLFATAFEEAGIAHELVLGSDHQAFPFDPEFDSWNYLDEPFFYFPKQDRFLAPVPFEFRYGLIPFQWRDNYALFVDPSTGGENSLAKGDVRFIEDVDVTKHFDDIDIEVAFPSDFDHVDLVVKRSMSGYRANFIQPYFGRLPVETQDEVVESILRSSGEEGTIGETSVLHAEEGDIYAERPFIIEGSMESGSLLEKAGRRYLFKLGDVIGPQVEMYQERERQFDVDVEYPHTYKRTIRINVPEGYRFKGQEDILIDIRYEDEEGEPLMGFISTYEEREGILQVQIDEYYNKTAMDKARFEEFRRVINAAADFNKVTLVLEPES